MFIEYSRIDFTYFSLTYSFLHILKIDDMAITPPVSSQVIPGMFHHSLNILYSLYSHDLLSLPKKSWPFCFVYRFVGPQSAGPKIYDNSVLPELPSVPDTLPNSSLGGNSTATDDIDFDDLSRRFEELKKKT